MLHLRVVVPDRLTDRVVATLRAEAATYNICVHRGSAVDPAGDLVTCDLAREGANSVIAALRDADVERHGSIAVDDVNVALGDIARRVDDQTPGHGSEAAVWEDVDARVWDSSQLTFGFMVFLVIATIIAVVGIIEDSPILIVGAMVVGPEFGPVTALAVGLAKRGRARIVRASTTLLAGVVGGVVAAAGATLVADLASLVPEDLVPHDLPATGFIVEPSEFSVLVALLAGVAGTLSLTQAKSSALVGVLISVTTIPAIAAMGLSAALGQWDDAWGATAQLGVNLVSLVSAALGTIWVQRRFSRTPATP